MRGDIMMVRIIRSAALALSVLLSLGVGASPALTCKGTECRTAGKPFDLKKFMRVQAASTRTPEAMRATRGKAPHQSRTARSGGAHVKIAHARHLRHRTVRAAHNSQPAEAPRDTALAFAEQDSIREVSNVQVVSADEFNDIDRAAGPEPAETTGAPAPARDVFSVTQNVQTVIEKGFNEVDSKAAELARPADTVAETTSKAASRSAPEMNWMQWLWSALGAGFVVLAGVARYLFA
jgi:hypothetical protein